MSIPEMLVQTGIVLVSVFLGYVLATAEKAGHKVEPFKDEK